MPRKIVVSDPVAMSMLENLRADIDARLAAPPPPKYRATLRDRWRRLRHRPIPPLYVDDISTAVRRLGELTLDFGLIERGTFHQDGKRSETDTTHTVMLGLIACSLADLIGGLDVGRVARRALAHDYPEVLAGDTRTLKMPTDRQTIDKRALENVAWHRIRGMFAGTLPWVAREIDAYNNRATREDDFVWGVDKIVPKICHIANGNASAREQGISHDQMIGRYAAQRREVVDRCGRWPLLIAIYDQLVTLELDDLADAR